MPRKLTVAIEKFPINGRFTIARGAKTEAVVVCVQLAENGSVGRGECVPYGRYGENPENVVAAIEAMREQIEGGVNRSRLQSLMKSGAARNAIDCALWDLEAKLTGVPACVSAEAQPLKSATTAFTISLGTPEEMYESTRKAADRPLLKIKLGGSGGDLDRIRAVRKAAPSASLIADANEGWTPENIVSHLEACRESGFALIEQPLPASDDEFLRAIKRVVPLCADESVHDRASLDRLVGLYDAINVKLDKTGGLTEALALSRLATEKGFQIMVGCMVGTSLGMAPAMLIAGNARFVDLDGPLLLARDRNVCLRYEGSTIHPPAPELWG
jgi:L-alanine-DL-glutamate epimerase-like enolase superfamily enzyme